EKRSVSLAAVIFFSGDQGCQHDDRQRLEHDHEHVLPEERADVVYIVRGEEGKTRQSGEPPTPRRFLRQSYPGNSVGNSSGGDKGSQETDKPARPILRTKKPDQGNSHHMK